jgi:hypothetical protein
LPDGPFSGHIPQFGLLSIALAGNI